jgi:hypothetical protein
LILPTVVFAFSSFTGIPIPRTVFTFVFPESMPWRNDVATEGAHSAMKTATHYKTGTPNAIERQIPYGSLCSCVSIPVARYVVNPHNRSREIFGDHR